MIKIKDRIPNIDALNLELDLALENNLTAFVKATSETRQSLVSTRWLVGISVLFLMLSSSALFLLIQAAMVVMLFFIIALFVLTQMWFTQEKNFAQAMSTAMTPVLSSLFDISFKHTKSSEHDEETKSLLSESNLLTAENIDITSDDMYHTLSEASLSFREIIATQRVQQGENHTNTVVFKGILVVADTKYYVGETYISTDGDRSGFAHKTFWSNLFSSSEIKETILEANDFEADLHVASNNPTAAREILTPNFMIDLHDWWKEHKSNMRIVFKDKRMLMLLPESTIVTSHYTTSTKPIRIKKYLLSLAKPIWRSLYLIEDVRR